VSILEGQSNCGFPSTKLLFPFPFSTGAVVVGKEESMLAYFLF